MYAVIQTGGKQYRVAVGDRLQVETLGVEPGDSIELDKVLMISDEGNVQVGTPVLDGTTVSADVVDNGRGEKIKVFKMHRRQGYRRTQGHRQNYTEIEITSIAGKGATAKPVKKKKAKAKVEAVAPIEAPTEVADQVADDLTQISGIGPVIAEKLNGLGYSTIAQLAELDDSAVAEIEEQLSFKGRVEREEWIKQAKELVS